MGNIHFIGIIFGNNEGFEKWSMTHPKWSSNFLELLIFQNFAHWFPVKAFDRSKLCVGKKAHVQIFENSSDQNKKAKPL